mgnify:CR=1
MKSNFPILVRCPECGRVSDSIKRYEMPHYFLCLYVFATWKNIEFTCCPHCMRKHILIKCFTYNILAANIVWPFYILPWGIILLIRSLTKGHSKEVQQIIENNY